jgi:large subunit ribosomal protein L17
MRHRIKKNGNFSFGRDGYLNTVISLFKHKRLNITISRAKNIKSFAERMITLAKNGENLSVRRNLISRLGNNEVVANDLIKFVNSSALKDRKGGYTRIVKDNFRSGDKSDVCFFEIIQ